MERMLAIVWHSRTGASEALARAAAEGAAGVSGGGGCRLLRVQDCGPDDLLAAAGYLFVGPENLGGLSGAMKELLDRSYYALLGRIEGRPYATIVSAGSDGHGAQAQLDRIVTGWRLRRVAEPMIVNLGAQTPQEILAPKHVPAGHLIRARQLGEALSAGIGMGVF